MAEEADKTKPKLQPKPKLGASKSTEGTAAAANVTESKSDESPVSIDKKELDDVKNLLEAKDKIIREKEDEIQSLKKEVESAKSELNKVREHSLEVDRQLKEALAANPSGNSAPEIEKGSIADIAARASLNEVLDIDELIELLDVVRAATDNTRVSMLMKRAKEKIQGIDKVPDDQIMGALKHLLQEETSGKVLAAKAAAKIKG